MSKEKTLGKYLVSALRDQPMRRYFEIVKIAQREESSNLPREEDKTRENERYAFLASMDNTQLEVLNKLVLSILDGAAFTLLRELQESSDGCEGREKINLVVDGTPSGQLELVSGNLYGDYFEWVEEFSDYGKFQH